LIINPKFHLMKSNISDIGSCLIGIVEIRGKFNK